MDSTTWTQACPVLLALVAASALEACVPLRRQQRIGHGQLGTNAGLTLITMALGASLNVVLVGCAMLATTHGIGLLSALPGTGATRLLLGVVALDFAAYAAHVAMHRCALLWRVHEVHHLDSAVDASTALRQHPFEGLVRVGFAAIAVLLFGVTPAAVALDRALSALNAVFEHANIRVPRAIDRVLGLLWVTPDMHKLHHAHDRALSDSNYANLFALFDRAFGSYTPPQALAPLRYGIAGREHEQAQTLRALLALPFRRDRTVARLHRQTA